MNNPKPPGETARYEIYDVTGALTLAGTLFVAEPHSYYASKWAVYAVRGLMEQAINKDFILKRAERYQVHIYGEYGTLPLRYEVYYNPSYQVVDIQLLSKEFQLKENVKFD